MTNASDRTDEEAATGRRLHPRHGIHAPRSELQARRPGSVRRTVTIDAVRPGAVDGDLVQIGRGRDLYTAPDGSAEVVGVAEVETLVDFLHEYRLARLRTAPERPALAGIIGTSVSTGFRAAMVNALADDNEQATLLHALLDDLPGAALVSGYALGAAGVAPRRSPLKVSLQIENLCAGFRTDGTIMIEMGTKGRNPVVTGPPATSIVPLDDPLAWHELRPLGAHDMRRWRCLDVWRLDDGSIGVEAYFRDSHRSPEGLETVVHEYTSDVVIDPDRMVVVSSAATAHSLPWQECIEAEASGARLAGRAVAGLRPEVRETFVGPSTCTHLNDTLRSIADVRALVPLLESR